MDLQPLHLLNLHSTHTQQIAAKVWVGVMKPYMNQAYRVADPLSHQGLLSVCQFVSVMCDASVRRCCTLNMRKDQMVQDVFKVTGVFHLSISLS